MEKRELIDMYTKMLTIRRFEEKVIELFSKGMLPGFVHLYIGEEAVAVGVSKNLRQDDYVVSTHRGHGHCIAKGADINKMMAELFGRQTGYCHGLGGSLHIADMSIGMLGATGIVGAGIPIAVGAGLSIALKKTDQVVVSFFGEGASNQGTFHEALNLASIWKLPLVFVCENNQYAVSFHFSKSTSVKNVAERAVAYGMPGVTVDGNDVLSVYRATHEAVKRARGGGGPTLLECKTYRWRGHFEGDPQLYRTREEIEEWKKKCPIDRFEAELMEKGFLNEEEAKKIDSEISKKLEDAVKFAEGSPQPSMEKLKEHVFA